MWNQQQQAMIVYVRSSKHAVQAAFAIRPH
ncbi:hypothetical protein FHS17_000503 [Paenibacillus lupini]|nr:hypothetical protein [Paenibacillus lupini]